MKSLKALGVLILLCTASLFGQTGTVSMTGTIGQINGTNFNGYLSIRIPKANVRNTCASPSVIIPTQTITYSVVNGVPQNLSSGHYVSQDCMSVRVPYYVEISDTNHMLVGSDNWYLPLVVGGIVDIGLMQESHFAGPINVAIPQAIISNPSVSQVITQPVGTSLTINGVTNINGSSTGIINGTTINSIVMASSYTTLDAIEAACTATGLVPCGIDVTTAQTFTLSGNHVMPLGMCLTYEPSGRWTINGSFTFTYSCGDINAPDNTQIFAGSATIAGLNYARPDWFGQPSSGSYPASAMFAAYTALNSGGSLLFRNANYLSAFNISPVANAGVISKPVSLIGAGRPIVDSLTAPTRYISGTGTVIQGSINAATSGLTILNLSDDFGSYVSTTFYGGYTGISAQGIFLANPHPMPNVPFTGTYWDNVGVLVTPLTGRHTLLNENSTACFVNNVDLWDPGIGWGFIDKSANCAYSNITVHGATDISFYSKSDFASNGNGFSSNNNWVNLHAMPVDGLTHPAGPFKASGEGDVNGHSTVTNLIFDTATVGIFIETDTGSTQGTVTDWTFNNVVGKNMYGTCAYIGVSGPTPNQGQYTTHITINDLSCESMVASGNGAVTILPAVAHTRINNLTVTTPNASAIYALQNFGTDTHVNFVNSDAATYCLVDQNNAVGATYVDHYSCPNASTAVFGIVNAYPFVGNLVGGAEGGADVVYTLGVLGSASNIPYAGGSGHNAAGFGFAAGGGLGELDLFTSYIDTNGLDPLVRFYQNTASGYTYSSYVARGGFFVGSVEVLPQGYTCSSQVAGLINYVAGASGTKDSVSICAKDASNVYAYRSIY